ncbi:MAG: hypothetical protein ACTSX7_16015 [Alphaproteobacteria bacterium]
MGIMVTGATGKTNSSWEVSNHDADIGVRQSGPTWQAVIEQATYTPTAAITGQRGYMLHLH